MWPRKAPPSGVPDQFGHLSTPWSPPSFRPQGRTGAGLAIDTATRPSLDPSSSCWTEQVPSSSLSNRRWDGTPGRSRGRQVDRHGPHRGTEVIADRAGGRGRLLVEREGQAVRHHPFEPDQADRPVGQRRLIELQGPDPPGVGVGRTHPGLEVTLVVAVLGLEVLRREERLSPDRAPDGLHGPLRTVRELDAWRRSPDLADPGPRAKCGTPPAIFDAGGGVQVAASRRRRAPSPRR
jgi:hypothetical protein